MRRSAFARRRPIAKGGTKRSQGEFIQYVGLVTEDDDDLLKGNVLTYATDTRISKKGRQKTRHGNDKYSVPIGETASHTQTSTTGASTVSFNQTTRVAEEFTASNSNRITAVDLKIGNPSAATGTVLVAIYDDNSGAPGNLLGLSSIASTDIPVSADYVQCNFIEAPVLVNTNTFWVVVYVQAGGTGSYVLATTTNTTKADTSSDSGASWTTHSYSINYRVYTSTLGGVKGVYRAYRQNASAVTLLAHGQNLYTVNDVNGATTSIASGLNALATNYRFAMANDVLYYVNGKQKPRKYDFATDSEVTGALGSASLITTYKGFMFYVDADDKTKIFFSEFLDYDSFLSTNIIYAPTSKSPDPIVGFAPLNGALFVYKRATKYVIFGENRATFTISESIGQRGTFTQESVTYDDNFIYAATQEGIYKFNGTEEKNIARDILSDYVSLNDKESIVLEIHNSRLYVFYKPNGESANTRCWVYNTIYDVWESEDTHEHVGFSFARADITDKFIKGSSLVGAVYYGERESNDYHNVGRPLSWDIRTKFDSFKAPSQLKQIPYLRPRFFTQGNYSVDIYKATDHHEPQTLVDTISLANTGNTFDGSNTFNGAIDFSGSVPIAELSSDLAIPGEADYWQLGYAHEAAREPVEFFGHTAVVETRRLR